MGRADVSARVPCLNYGQVLKLVSENENSRAQERTQPLADALRNAPAATKRAPEGTYDPLPDLLRLERGTGSPVMATSDVPGRIGIMLRRDADFDRIIVAFRWGA
jgi:hypothetical protein